MPIAPGYQDFQTAANQRGLLVLNSAINIPTIAPQQIFKQATLAYNHTWLSIGITTGFYTLIVRHYDPFTSPLAIIDHRFVCAPGDTTMLIPNLLSGLELDVFASSVPGGENSFFSIGFTNGYSAGYRWLNDLNRVSSGTVSVGAGVTETFPLPFVQPGPAQCWFGNTGGAAGLGGFVGTYKTDGTIGDTLMELFPITVTTNLLVQLPPTPCFLGLFNTTGAAASMAGTLYATGGLY